jgi:hypothetical protein
MVVISFMIQAPGRRTDRDFEGVRAGVTGSFGRADQGEGFKVKSEVANV